MKKFMIELACELPDNYKWIAIDKDGTAFAYVDKPHVEEEWGTWEVGDEATCYDVIEVFHITYGLMQDFDWENSLIEIDGNK